MPPAAPSSPKRAKNEPKVDPDGQHHQQLERKAAKADGMLSASNPRRRGRPPAKKHPKGHLTGDDNLSVSGTEEEGEEALFRDFESIEDSDCEEDLGRTPVNKRNPNYRIVTVGKSGRPTEVFRTDRIHLLRTGHFNQEDSDEECGSNNGLLKLADRWREEWNHGVQVPVNARELPHFQTAENDLELEELDPFRMPVKYIGLKPESSGLSDLRHPASPTKYVRAETHAVGEVPSRLLYQADRMDEIWLEKKNMKRAALRQPAIPMRPFAEIMNSLEINCFLRIHEELLAPLHSKLTNNGVDEEAACDICAHADCEKDDAMVFCDGCNICVHLSCYGLEDAPNENEDWHCMRCLLSSGSNPPCLLCPISGGALKCTEKLSDGKMRWAHIGCALWIPECKFGDPEKREPITAINDILEDRWRMKCTICDTRQGACIQCSAPACTNAFHVGCAMRSGLEMRIEADPADPEGDVINFISLCNKHRSVKTIGESKGEDAENSMLGELESKFFIFVEEEKICKELDYGRELVSDVYEYWKLKRHAQGGKPLVKNLQDDIPVHLMPTSPKNEAGYSRLMRQTQLYSTSLQRGRDLLIYIMRREKARQERCLTEMGICQNAWEQMLSPFPLSDRVTGQLTDHVKAGLDPERMEKILEAEEELLLKEGGRLTTLTPSASSNSRSSTPAPTSSKRSKPVKSTPQEKPGFTSSRSSTPAATSAKRTRTANSKVPVEKADITPSRSSTPAPTSAKRTKSVKSTPQEKADFTASRSSTPVPVSAKRVRSVNNKAVPVEKADNSAKKTKPSSVVGSPRSEKKRRPSRDFANSLPSPSVVSEKKNCLRSRAFSTESDASSELGGGAPPSPCENTHGRTKTPSANNKETPRKKRKTLSSVPGFTASIKRNSEDFSYLDRNTPSPLVQFPKRTDLRSLARSGASVVSPVKEAPASKPTPRRAIARSTRR